MIPTRVRKPMPFKGLRTAWPADQLAPEEATRALNVRIKFGRVKEAPGRRLIGGNGVSEHVMHIGLFTKVDGTNWVFKITDAGLYRWGDSSPGVPGDWYAISGPAFNGSGRWAVATGEDKLFFSRRDEHGIFQWNGQVASPYALVVAGSGIVPAASHLAYFSDRIMALNVTVDPTGTPVVRTNRIQWPASGDYTSWGGLGASFLDEYEGVEEPINGCDVLGGRLVVFREHTIGDLIPTGGTPGTDLLFTFDVRTRGIGTRCPRSIVACADGVIRFLGRDMNIWAWDGVKAVPISLDIEDTLKGLLDPSKLNSYFAVEMSYQQEYWFIIDTGDVFVYDYLRNIWLRDNYPSITAVAEVDKITGAVPWSSLATTWDTEARTWADLEGAALTTIFAGRATGETFEITDQVSNDYFASGSIVDRYIETGDVYLPTPRLPEGDPMGQNGVIQRGLIVYDYVDSTPFEIWVSNTRGVTWPIQKTIIPDPKGYSFVDFNLASEGQPIRWRFKEQNADGRFRWSSYALEFLPGEI